MSSSDQAELLRIFVGESDAVGGRPVYELIVEEAHRQGLAGATVLVGTMGYGAHSEVHTSHIFRLSENLPVVIEIIDLPERIAAFLPRLDALVTGGMAMIEPVRRVLYRPAQPPKP
jgi:PII-like signaling protein